jgi:hypothetical protein
MKKSTGRQTPPAPCRKSRSLPASLTVGGIWMVAAVAHLLSAQAPPPQGFYTTLPVKTGREGVLSTLGAASLPMWNYNVTASADKGGATYTGQVVGRSPFSHGKTTTTIPTQIIPLVITINDGSTTVTYDPTAPDSCVTGSPTDVSIITASPIFTNNPWTMSGQNVGTTQYIDAFQRAEFWSLVGGTPYHLSLNQTTLPSQTASFGEGVAQNYNAATLFGGCGHIGVVDITAFDNAVQTLITSLGPTVNTGTFPILLTKAVVFGDPGHNLFSFCCVLGYHSGFNVGSNLQIYSPFSLDTTGTFGNRDVSTLSHEMAEAINDPTTNNPTPAWGNIGQTIGFCQNNFEVGDPLSPGFKTATNEFIVGGYHLQELAYFSWFYGGPSLGTAANRYSNNNTFTGYAMPCPPGGTN